MKLNALYIILLSSITFCGFSQTVPWANIGTVWHYDYTGFGIEGFTKYEVEKDTTINGKLCSKVSILSEYSNFGDSGYSSVAPPFFTYEEDSVLFFTTQNQFDTLMNLKASPGDSWILTNQSCTEDRFVEVLDTGRTTINSCENKWLAYSYEGHTTIVDTFYSYYGSVKHAFAYFDYCQENAMDKPVSVNLRCYDDGNCFYLNGTPDCESLSVHSEILKPRQIKLFPNPASSKITIEFSDSKLSNKTKYEIIGLNGEVVQKGDLANPTIDVSGMESGVYFLRLLEGGGYLGTKKLIIE
ncbi:MAG: T9SS type A sorting domain-containing protein [Brumimicrobium sp.]